MSNRTGIKLLKLLIGSSEPTVATHLLREASGTFLIKVAAAFLSILSGVVLARILGPSGYGSYAYVLSIVSLLSLLAAMGFPQLLVREVSAYHEKKRWDLMKGIIIRSHQVTLVASIVIVFSTAVLVYTGIFRLRIFESEVLLLALFLIPVRVITKVKTEIIRGYKYIVLSQLPSLVLDPLLFLLFVAFIYFLKGKDIVVIGAIEARVLSALVVLLIVTYLSHVRRPLFLKNISPVFRTRLWGKVALRMLFIGSLLLVMNQTDILMLGIFKNARDVGLYRVAQRCAQLIGFGLVAVNTTIAPTVSSLFAAGESERLQRLMIKSARSTVFYAMPLALLLILYGKPVISIAFGHDFVFAGSALILLVTGQFFSAIMGSVGIFLTMTGHEKDTAKGMVLAALLNVLLNGLFIPSWGILGAALATSSTLVLWNIFLGYMVHKRLDIYPSAVGFLAADRMNRNE